MPTVTLDLVMFDSMRKEIKDLTAENKKLMHFAYRKIGVKEGDKINEERMSE